MQEIEIYTDGACSGNPGPGGWGVIVTKGKKEYIMSGAESMTTNNRMELVAVLKGLEFLETCDIKSKYVVQVYSDSAYVCNAIILDWIGKWQANRWRTADNKPVLNQDLWHQLVEYTTKYNIVFNKVKGHADNEKNNRCDKLARTAISKLPVDSVEK